MYRADGLLSTQKGHPSKLEDCRHVARVVRWVYRYDVPLPQKGHLSKSKECKDRYVERFCWGVLKRAGEKEPDVFGSGSACEQACEA